MIYYLTRNKHRTRYTVFGRPSLLSFFKIYLYDRQTTEILANKVQFILLIYLFAIFIIKNYYKNIYVHILLKQSLHLSHVYALIPQKHMYKLKTRIKTDRALMRSVMIDVSVIFVTLSAHLRSSTHTHTRRGAMLYFLRNSQM